jgi:hypothetical protein
MAKNHPGKSKWHVVADKMNTWWEGAVFDGCDHNKWDKMHKSLVDGFGQDAGLEFKAIFPHDETVGDPGASKIQKKIYSLGNNKSRGTDIGVEDVLDMI